MRVHTTTPARAVVAHQTTVLLVMSSNPTWSRVSFFSMSCLVVVNSFQSCELKISASTNKALSTTNAQRPLLGRILLHDFASEWLQMQMKTWRPFKIQRHLLPFQQQKWNISILFLHLFFEFDFEAALSRKISSCYRNLIKRRIRKKWKTSDSAKTCPELKTASAKISSDQNLSGGRFFDLIFCKHSLENYFEIFYVLFYLNFPLSTSTS